MFFPRKNGKEKGGQLRRMTLTDKKAGDTKIMPCTDRALTILKHILRCMGALTPSLIFSVILNLLKIKLWKLVSRKRHYKESWAPKNWCFWTVVLEKTLESSLDCKEIQPVHPKRNQSWIFIVKTDAEAETPILWPLDAENWLIWKDPDAGKNWRWEEKGTTEDEMVGWHHRLEGHEFE